MDGPTTAVATTNRALANLIPAGRLTTLDGKRLLDIRDKAVLFIGFATAMRRGELVTLTVEDIRAYDAMIAATAISTDLPVFTCNPRDFADIDRLNVFVVAHPDHG